MRKFKHVFVLTIFLMVSFGVGYVCAAENAADEGVDESELESKRKFWKSFSSKGMEAVGGSTSQSSEATSEGPSKESLTSSTFDLKGGPVTELQYGASPSPKPTSSKFDIDLTEAPKSTSETEMVFESKFISSPSPSSMPSPKASKKK